MLVGGGRPAFGLASLGRVMMVRRRGSRGAGDERNALVPVESGGGDGSPRVTPDEEGSNTRNEESVAEWSES